VPTCGRNHGCCSLCTVSNFWKMIVRFSTNVISSVIPDTKRSLSAGLLLDFYYFLKSCLPQRKESPLTLSRDATVSLVFLGFPRLPRGMPKRQWMTFHIWKFYVICIDRFSLQLACKIRDDKRLLHRTDKIYSASDTQRGIKYLREN